MNLFKKIVIGFVFYAFPFVLLLFICAIVRNPDLTTTPYDNYSIFILVLIIVCLFWTLATLGLTVSMFFSKALRNSVLARLSGMKERDEREVQIAGRALKSSYLGSMTILLCLLSISFIQITFSKKSADHLKPGELPRSISLGYNCKLSDSDALTVKKEGYDIYIQYNGVPLSTTALIMILLIWQIVSYRYVSRKALRLPESSDF
jgi:hypothetical protein